MRVENLPELIKHYIKQMNDPSQKLNSRFTYRDKLEDIVADLKEEIETFNKEYIFTKIKRKD
jgi:hypothetical protein